VWLARTSRIKITETRARQIISKRAVCSNSEVAILLTYPEFAKRNLRVFDIYTQPKLNPPDIRAPVDRGM
jgi:hypothetical protein